MTIISCPDPEKPACEMCTNFDLAGAPTFAVFRRGFNGFTNGSPERPESE